MRRAFDEMLAGSGRLVLLGGEAGIGKSALVEDLRRHATAHDALVLTGQCHDLLEISPYTPWIEILQQYDPAEDFPQIPEQLRPGVDLSDARSQQALFEKGRDFFGALADLRPLVLVLEDAHWADQPSLEALHYVARWLARRRVLFIVTYRDDAEASGRPLFRMLPELVRALRPERLELRRITPAAFDQLVDARYGLPTGEHQRLVAFLTEFSSGNPFYALEILRSLEIDGLLERRHTGWALGDVGGFRMPALLRQIMSNRLAAQDEQARRWLEIAAVIGMEVPFALWAEVCEASMEQLAVAFERARDLALVREVPGRPSFEFSHALLREALYERLPLPRRLSWHARIADALAASPQPPADRIAHHYRLAGDSRAVDWLIRAGEEAQERYAWPAAIERYGEASAALEDNPERSNDLGWLAFRIGTLRRYEQPGANLEALARAERLAAESGDNVLLAYSRFMANLVQSFTARTNKPLDDLRESVREIDRLSAADLEASGALRTSLFADVSEGGTADPAINLGLGTLALRLASTGRHAEAEAAANEFLAMFKSRPAAGEPALKPYAAALTALGFVHTVRGQPEAAREALLRAREAYQHADDRRAVALNYFAELILVVNTFEHHRRDERWRLAAQSAEAMQRAQGAFPSELPPELFAFENFWIEGDWDQAVAYAAVAHELMAPDMTLAEIALCRGQLEEAWRIINRMLPDGPRTAPGRPSFLAQYNLIQIAARLCMATGEIDSALAWIECHARWVEWGEMTVGLADLALLRAEHNLLSGAPVAARAEAQRAVELAEQPRQALVLMPAHRLLAWLDVEEARFEDAELHIQRASDIARAAGAPFELALGQLVEAELRIATGRRAGAAEVLAAATDVFERLGAAPCVERAEELRSRLAPSESETAYPGGLSAREVEVLRLVAEGLTDAEVAERLYISRRTVSQHLRSIYNKLGIGSRVAATRFALDHDLV